MDAVAALRAGRPVLLPTDTVYGLAARADEVGAQAVYALKGRGHDQPTALLAATVDDLLLAVPELARDLLDALLPGPYTLVLPNPARRFAWLAGATPEKLGVRVPDLPAQARAAVEAVGVVLATSANEPGGANPVALEDVPARIRAGCAAEIDAGPLPGTASTVLDLTGPEPRVLREGAIPGADALSTINAWRLRSRRSTS
ncbi:MAG TPA: L-threonylcarbamoyladenylate synthase [Gaiellaceae bacterium]|jgi:tRNA threonylcarbamoyl adenosine modification protein (Sua5/YciO/YrdC/YwlC family)